MPQVTLKDISIGFRGPSLLDKVSCRIERGERIGLLGRNGTGKTTLMTMLAGDEQPDHGAIEFEAGTRVAFLTQEVPPGLAGTVASVIVAGYDERVSDGDADWKRTRGLERILLQMQLDGDALFEQLSTGVMQFYWPCFDRRSRSPFA